MLHNEIAEVIENTSMYEIASKTIKGFALTDDEVTAVANLDAWAREIGKTGKDTDHEIAAFINKVVNEEIYNTPDELLDAMFNQGTIGEFDDYEVTTTPENTLLAPLAAKGGNVEKSYLDISVITPVWKNRQVEAEISYQDMRRNGWKSIALLSEYALATLKNTMFSDIFTVIDSTITSGDNYINESTTKPTAPSMDAMALYLNDRNDGNGVIVGLNKYIQAASKLAGFVSEEMKNEVHRTGRLGTYDGVSLVGISSAKKLGNGNLLIPNYRMFGIAGKVGDLNMKGEIHTYETMDNNSERVSLKIADFTYGYAFYKSTLENMCKMALATA